MIYVYKAKVIKVEAYDRVKLNVDLGFSLKMFKTFNLDGYSVSDSEETLAKSCLVLILGGRRVLIKVEKKGSEEIKWVSRIFIHERYDFDEEVSETVSDKRLVCVNLIMRQLEDFKYEPEVLKGKKCD